MTQVFVPPPSFFIKSSSGSSSIHPSFTRSDSSSAVTTPKPISCISCQARIRHWQETERVRYLTAWTSWLGIYADDDSHCPLAILFAGAHSPTTLARLLSCFGLLSLSVCLSISHCPCLCSKYYWVGVISERDVDNFLTPFGSAIQQSSLSQMVKDKK